MRIVFLVSEDKNLGVGYLSSYLKKHGHQVYLLFDPCQFAKSYIRNDGLAAFFSKTAYFLRRLKEINPDLIGFSVVTANYQWALNLAEQIKDNLNIPIIFGGVHPTLVPERVIFQDAVDMVCVGEAEEAMLELADKFGKTNRIGNIYFKEKGIVIKNPVRPLEQDLDKYPFPDEELFYDVLPPSYRLTSSVMTSRGCPFFCTYCSNHSLAGIYQGQKYVRRRSPGNVLNELCERKYRFNARHFVFMDDIFSSDIEWLEEFIPRYKKEINLPFNCLAHPSLVNEKVVSFLKEGGCTTVDFGLQSGSERLRKEMLNRHEPNSSIISAARACKKHKIHFAVDQILNIPHESEEDILASLELLNILRPAIVNCFSLVYFPKAVIIAKAKEAGALTKEDIENIEEGRDNLYSSASITATGKSKVSFYRRYALLFCSLPLLPRKLVSLIIRSRLLRNAFSAIPFFLMPFVKVIIDLRGGLGFIPLAVLQNEVFYIRQQASYNKYLKRT